jgi:tetratricopeptide (TPR) repeat protein
MTAVEGRVEVADLAPGRYTVHAIADDYEAVKRTIDIAGEHPTASLELRRSFEEITTAPVGGGSWSMTKSATGVNVQKERETLKVLAALRSNQPEKARATLEQLNRDYPFDANMSYLYAIYEKQKNDLPRAKSYWEKAIGLDPRHFASLVELGQSALDGDNAAMAIPYLRRAVQAKPLAWQPHALLVMAYAKQKQYDEVVKEADRALELGRNAAAAVQPVLASALAAQGNKDRAIQVLRDFLKVYSDQSAWNLLVALQPGETPLYSSSTGGGLPSAPDLEVSFPKDWMSTGVDGSAASRLSPLGQRLFAKALKGLQENRMASAHDALSALQDLVPSNPDVNYLFGIYELQAQHPSEAEVYWQRALESYSTHMGALLQLSQEALRENSPAAALPLLNRAMAAEPEAWRPHALIAQAFFEQGQYAEAVREADRALGLGHENASIVRPLLARVMAAQGNEQGATEMAQSYMKVYPEGVRSEKHSDTLQLPPPSKTASSHAMDMPSDMLPILPSAWTFTNVDLPPVEAGVACALDDVLARAAKSSTQLLKDVDRFTATESLIHERIGSTTLTVDAETEYRKFNYLVSISEVQGFLSVDEYRSGPDSLKGFPDGLSTVGLPALALVFHPLQAGNFNFVCEGLSQRPSGPAWQIRFQQREDKPATLHVYTLGGLSFPVPLRGRAWVSAKTYQVVRLESDLVKPLLKAHLVTEHTVVDYGPVQFKSKNVTLWLPQSADIYFDWRGRRVHRRHSFSDYMLFSVDDKQNIATPKTAETTPPESPAAPPSIKPN